MPQGDQMGTEQPAANPQLPHFEYGRRGSIPWTAVAWRLLLAIFLCSVVAVFVVSFVVLVVKTFAHSPR